MCEVELVNRRMRKENAFLLKSVYGIISYKLWATATYPIYLFFSDNNLDIFMTFWHGESTISVSGLPPRQYAVFLCFLHADIKERLMAGQEGRMQYPRGE
jgi:hypothetical protein